MKPTGDAFSQQFYKGVWKFSCEDKDKLTKKNAECENHDVWW